jgi:hypothetical protein
LIPEFTMLVEDLAHVTNEDLKSRALSTFSKLVLWALRDARDADQLLDNLATWGRAFQEATSTPRGMESVRVLLRYIALVTQDLHLTKFRAKLHELAPEAEEATMTLAEQWEATGQSRALTKLLTLKFGELPPTYATRLASASLVELDAWIERVLSAATLDDVFAT